MCIFISMTSLKFFRTAPPLHARGTPLSFPMMWRINQSTLYPSSRSFASLRTANALTMTFLVFYPNRTGRGRFCQCFCFLTKQNGRDQILATFVQKCWIFLQLYLSFSWITTFLGWFYPVEGRSPQGGRSHACGRTTNGVTINLNIMPATWVPIASWSD